MVKKTIKILAAVVMVVTAVGCATTSEQKMGNLTVRRYVEDRPRVDQDLAGNSGFVYGAPQVETKDRKETRRLYYVEFSQQNSKDKVEIEEKDYSLPAPEPRTPHKADRSSIESVPVSAKASNAKPVYYGYSEPAENAAYDAANSMKAEAVTNTPAASVSLPQEYKVQDNDTLQKISQKFYGSYGKWTKIYEANKETLKDPNRIIPGKTITIPAL